MRFSAQLTPREAEVAELLAWGAAKKEVADRLYISTRTVENTTRNIYEKVGIQKATELCVWWFCTRCGISFDLSPIKRQLLSVAFLLMFLPQLVDTHEEFVCRRRTGQNQTERQYRPRIRRNEEDLQYI